MEQSILKSTKKILGVPEDDDAFDLDVLTHINAALSTLNQMGVGPEDGFSIEDDSSKWEDFLPDEKMTMRNKVKDFVYLTARSLFDPPSTSYLVTAQEKQLEQLAWRINTERESTDWVDSNPPAEEEEVFP